MSASEQSVLWDFIVELGVGEGSDILVVGSLEFLMERF